MGQVSAPPAFGREAELLFGMGCIPSAVGLPVQPDGAGDRPAETIVPERGGRMASLGNRGLAGVEPGHYGDIGSDRKRLL